MNGESLGFPCSFNAYASATTAVVGASRDSLASEASAEGQSIEAYRYSKVDPASGAAEALHSDIVSVLSELQFLWLYFVIFFVING